MRRGRLDHLLSGAAVAIALALMGSAGAEPLSQAQIEAAMPVPDTSELPPPTIADISPATTVAPPKAAPAPIATGSVNPVATVDGAVAEKLREIANGAFDRILGGKRERTAVEAFYSERNFAPIWTSNGAANERAKAAIGYLARVDADGLDPDEYPTPQFKAGADADALAEAELRLTQSVLAFARHASSGRVHYSRVSVDIAYEHERPEPARILQQLADSSNVAATLDGLLPQHPAYKALKAKLAEARGGVSRADHPRIAAGPLLKLGKVAMKDARVPLLRERLGVAGDSADTTYDKSVADAVAKFQREHQLQATGSLNQATIQALNGVPRHRDADVIIANLERWRWMPRELGSTHVMVNIPDYMLKVVRDGKIVWQTRIVVGKPTQATPITTAEMKFITVNPTWNVPPSIIQNEYLPALQQDPMALERIGLKVTQNADGTIRIYQPPGDRNALGRIRFNFPNKFLVYQHDTPDKHYFAHDKRAYSHGCMRVQDPLKYGEVLLSLVRPGEGYTAEKLRSMFGGAEININFPTTIPVHLTYQTAFVDEAGKLVMRDDVYGRDARVVAALKGAERRHADVPSTERRYSATPPVRMPPGSFGGPYHRSYGGPSFFDRLFGPIGPPTPPRPVGNRTRAAWN